MWLEISRNTHIQYTNFGLKSFLHFLLCGSYFTLYIILILYLVWYIGFQCTIAYFMCRGLFFLLYEWVMKKSSSEEFVIEFTNWSIIKLLVRFLIDDLVVVFINTIPLQVNEPHRLMNLVLFIKYVPTYALIKIIVGRING